MILYKFYTDTPTGNDRQPVPQCVVMDLRSQTLFLLNAQESEQLG